MSIGTAMVLIALGVFFYLKPNVFRVTAKWSAVAIAVAAVAVGGWYIYDQHRTPAWAQAPMVVHAPLCREGTVYPNTVDHCAPWDRKWAKTDVLQPGATVEDDGRITSAEENKKVMAEMEKATINPATGKPYDVSMLPKK